MPRTYAKYLKCGCLWKEKGMGGKEKVKEGGVLHGPRMGVDHGLRFTISAEFEIRDQQLAWNSLG